MEYILYKSFSMSSTNYTSIDGRCGRRETSIRGYTSSVL